MVANALLADMLADSVLLVVRLHMACINGIFSTIIIPIGPLNWEYLVNITCDINVANKNI